MSKNKNNKDKKIPKKDRARAKRAARVLRGGVPEPKLEESEVFSDALIDGEAVANQPSVDLPDPNDDPLARPSTADPAVAPKDCDKPQVPDGDIPAGRGAKPAPRKPIKLPNRDWAPHFLQGD